MLLSPTAPPPPTTSTRVVHIWRCVVVHVAGTKHCIFRVMESLCQGSADFQIMWLPERVVRLSRFTGSVRHMLKIGQFCKYVNCARAGSLKGEPAAGV